ncbi:type-F conjugative transfer system pilin assembly thiol-disulfide isomerase TrbB [Providencia rettgeri]|uniref:type-F conjugative transfer system pilin assembly thiol-disulfide isomerase TrbB n=1 Tax=Providencia rettgeri TaxID=587 RepID=UPI001B391B9D|nr:type-F conjugative transfer system pilin assembly thiol-disulfide isomerase TrbB [Providencia rettgeri]MBQ0211394.1 type-F conjugative transfer system pilin assembly thiol-disulfide isomerase TrbB [Providencia rettgeri]MDH2379501.1 type-F conjugative transfer system pilin assembly thiol-disulfide isomerase TrbB [Providencia rettgeri]MDR9617000.1 type-F conjugative transfer system pilin assembly thiol-disulfide isomerase TrbB [Providencia rettgeri]MDW7803728.1 type-F conjugative transfer syst
MMLAMMLFFSGLVQASVMDDIAELEAHKTATSERETVIEEETPPSKINTVAVKPYRLPNGKVVNLNDYTLVLFMQAKCPYCQQFDPQLALLSVQTGFKVFAYTLDGQGDMAFPNAIPAPAEVVQTFFGAGMQVVTPSVFLVEVNTLRTYPLLQGLTDMQDVMNRINSNLMIAIQ